MEVNEAVDGFSRTGWGARRVECADETQGREDANGQMGSSEEILRIEGLDKSFGTLEALKSIDLKVAKGEVVFIIGPSGSGKSTLLRCINRLEEPTRGQITVGGTVITGPGVNLNRIRQDIGFVFQAFNLYPHMTAMGNVTLALRRVLKMSRTAARERGQAVLDDVGLSDKYDAHPNELSGGQQQRVAIARALALQPKMMLFDEVTSALDPELVGEVLNVIREMRERGMTMIVVSHEMTFAREAADRVIFMNDGEIVEEGPPAKVLSDPQHRRTKEFLSRFLNS